MSKMSVIVPSRGRPHNIARAMSFWEANNSADVEILVAVDPDDETLAGYRAITSQLVVLDQRMRLGPCLNFISGRLVADGVSRIGFMGDDNIPRTANWDQIVVDALDDMGSGIVYGNDLIQGAALPTAVFMTSDIIEALGYMCPPGLIHLFLDNAWKALGEATGRLRYLPQVVIEHCHPCVGKAGWDTTYKEANSPATYIHDQAEFRRWQTEDLPGEAVRIRSMDRGSLPPSPSTSLSELYPPGWRRTG